MVKVDVYAPNKPDPITFPGSIWDAPYPNLDAARQAITADLANNPVRTIDVTGEDH